MHESPTPLATPESPGDAGDRLLYPWQVYAVFRVSASTLRRWAVKGLITSQRTLGGHRRYRESEVRARIAAVAS